MPHRHTWHSNFTVLIKLALGLPGAPLSRPLPVQGPSQLGRGAKAEQPAAVGRRRDLEPVLHAAGTVALPGHLDTLGNGISTQGSGQSSSWTSRRPRNQSPPLSFSPPNASVLPLFTQEATKVPGPPSPGRRQQASALHWASPWGCPGPPAGGYRPWESEGVRVGRAPKAMLQEPALSRRRDHWPACPEQRLPAPWPSAHSWLLLLPSQPVLDPQHRQ